MRLQEEKAEKRLGLACRRKMRTNKEKLKKTELRSSSL